MALLLTADEISNSRVEYSRNPFKWKFLNFLAFILKLFCLLPYTGYKTYIYSLQQMWAFVVLFFILAMNCIEIGLLDKNMKSIYQGFYISAYATTTLTVIWIFKETFHNKIQYKERYQEYIRLYEMLNEIDFNDKNDQKSYFLYIALRKSLGYLIILLTIYLSVCCALSGFYRDFSSINFLRIFVAHLLPNILIIWYLSIYWLIMKAILVLYKLSNRVLMDALHCHMEETNTSYCCLSLWYRNEFENSNPFKTKPLMEIISVLSDFRSRLDKHLENVLGIFHIPLMMNFLSVFFMISIQTFELYTYCDTPDIDDINALLWMLMQLLFSTWRAIFVLLVHNSITNEVSELD